VLDDSIGVMEMHNKDNFADISPNLFSKNPYELSRAKPELVAKIHFKGEI